MRGKISELRQTVRSRVSSTSASDFKQGSTTPTWKEARRPYEILDDSHARNHLLFSVDVPSVRVLPDARGNYLEGYDLEADVRVQFISRIRAGQHTDEDSAADAAEAVASSILTLGEEDHRYGIEPVEIHSAQPTPDGEGLLVEQRYRVRFTIPFPVEV